jgi:2-hydroxy-3-oxopropionate reductase
METAREVGVSLPTTALVAQLMAAAVARGRGGSDHSVLVELVRDMSGRGSGTGTT